MLPAKPWRFEAVVRLGAGIALCVLMGSLVESALHAHFAKPKAAWIFYPAFALSLALLLAALWLLREPWQGEKAMRRLARVLACFYGALMLGGLAQTETGRVTLGPSVEQMIIASVSFQGAALLLVWRFLRDHELNWPEAFGFRHQWRQALVLGFILAGLFLPVGWTLQWVSARVMIQLVHMKPEEQQAVQTLQLAGTWASRVVLGIITIGLAPFAEEVLFRGILYPWIKQLGYPRLALWSTSLLFAAIHLSPVSFVPLAALALGLAILYERTNNLLASIAAHALFNGFNFALLYLFQ